MASLCVTLAKKKKVGGEKVGVQLDWGNLKCSHHNQLK